MDGVIFRSSTKIKESKKLMNIEKSLNAVLDSVECD